jgi:hypothetical protein
LPLPTRANSAPPASVPPHVSAAPPPAEEATPPEPAAPTFAGPFPPPACSPLYERTAKPEDCTWTPWSQAGGDPALMAVTTLHPHPIKPHPFVTVVAFDRREVELFLVAGTDEPASKTVPAERRSGLVPRPAQPQLLAVFNGGFMARHGNFGMMVDGDVFVPPKDDACVIGLAQDGSIRIGSWPRIGGELAQARAWRQTPPCLVEGGAPNPRLPEEHHTRRWGAAEDGNREVRRSALGLDPSGRSLLYGFGDWVTATELAAAMKAAGGVDVAQLDINWSYTRFYTFEQVPGAAPRIVATLVPKAKYRPNNYVEEPAHRDFFYAARRGAGAAAPSGYRAVPAEADPAP